MPNLQPHVTGLELSLALKEAGWPQGESVCIWWDDSFSEEPVLMLVEDMPDAPGVATAAPLATELMERMKNANFVVEPRNHGWVCFHCPRKKNGELTGEQFPLYDQSIPDALAKLALHLVKEGNMRF